MAFATAARVSAIAPRAAVAKRGAGACEGCRPAGATASSAASATERRDKGREGLPLQAGWGGARKHMCGTKMAAGRARGARKRAHAASGRPRERSTADQFAAAHSALRSISWHHRAPRGANCAGYATYTPGFPKGRLQGVDPSAPVALRGTMPPDIATPSIKKLKAPFPFPPPSPIITLLLHKKIYPPLICFRALER